MGRAAQQPQEHDAISPALSRAVPLACSWGEAARLQHGTGAVPCAGKSRRAAMAASGKPDELHLVGQKESLAVHWWPGRGV